MPKVDSETGVPMSDDPNQADPALRGGKQLGDPALDDASANGDATTKKGRDYSDSHLLPAERPSEK